MWEQVCELWGEGAPGHVLDPASLWAIGCLSPTDSVSLTLWMPAGGGDFPGTSSRLLELSPARPWDRKQALPLPAGQSQERGRWSSALPCPPGPSRLLPRDARGGHIRPRAPSRLSMHACSVRPAHAQLPAPTRHGRPGAAPAPAALPGPAEGPRPPLPPTLPGVGGRVGILAFRVILPLSCLATVPRSVGAAQGQASAGRGG